MEKGISVILLVDDRDILKQYAIAREGVTEAEVEEKPAKYLRPAVFRTRIGFPDTTKQSFQMDEPFQIALDKISEVKDRDDMEHLKRFESNIDDRIKQAIIEQLKSKRQNNPLPPFYHVFWELPTVETDVLMFNFLRQFPEKYPRILKIMGWDRFVIEQNGMKILKPIPLDWLVYGIERFISYHFDMDSEDIMLVSYWIALQNMFENFYLFPYLNITGISGSGKSSLAEFLRELSISSVKMVSSSISVLFRIANKFKTLLYLDEISFSDNEEANSILLGGYSQHNSLVGRSKKDTYEPELFDVYCPKMFVGVAELEPMLLSRCISIVMNRTSDKRFGKRLTVLKYRDWEVFKLINSYAFITLLANGKQLFSNFYDLIEGFDDSRGVIKNRLEENALPFFALAKTIGNTEYEMLMRAFYKNYADVVIEETETVESMVLSSIHDMMERFGVEKDKYKMLEFRVLELQENMKALGIDISVLPTTQKIGRVLRRLGFGKNNPAIGYKIRQGKTIYYIRNDALDMLIEKYGVQSKAMKLNGIENKNSGKAGSVLKKYGLIRRDIIMAVNKDDTEAKKKVWEAWERYKKENGLEFSKFLEEDERFLEWRWTLIEDAIKVGRMDAKKEEWKKEDERIGFVENELIKDDAGKEVDEE